MFHRHRYLLTCLLCLTMAAESTSLSIQHSHERGDGCHSHGFAPWAITARPCCRGENADAMNISRKHSHRVYFGIEFYGEESDAASRHLPANTDAQVGNGIDAAVDTSSLASQFTQEAAIPCFLTPLCLFAFSPSVSIHFSGHRVPAPRTTLCDPARGERSGVSNI